MTTENSKQASKSQKNKAEPKRYENALSMLLGNAKKVSGGHPFMEEITTLDNLLLACERVKKNKGQPGIDGMTVEEIEGHIRQYHPHIRRKLMDGTYKPQPVRRVHIPKPNGGTRSLGIPVVRDRVIQQAIRQVIEPFINPTFSRSSHGFRPGKSPKTAMKQVTKYYEEGYTYVVDCDLKQYFDTINHDKLMYLLGKHIPDKRVLTIIRKFLTCGAIDMKNGFEMTRKGAPQGGVISPLLSNIYLHQLDEELERRGHKFVRYADDFVVCVKSQRAGERVMESITKFLEKELKLTVNRDKSKVGSPTRLKFLGCLMRRVNKTCRFTATKEKQKSFLDSLRYTTRRNRPGTMKEIIKELNLRIRGWINYFGIGHIKGFIKRTEAWLRRRLRQLVLKRWKKCSTKINWLIKYGLSEDEAKCIAYSRKKYWRLSKTKEVHKAMSNERIHKWGLVSMTELAQKVYLSY